MALAETLERAKHPVNTLKTWALTKDRDCAKALRFMQSSKEAKEGLVVTGDHQGAGILKARPGENCAVGGGVCGTQTGCG